MRCDEREVAPLSRRRHSITTAVPYTSSSDAPSEMSVDEKRTAVMAFKLAELEWMRQRIGEWPISGCETHREAIETIFNERLL